MVVIHNLVVLHDLYTRERLFDSSSVHVKIMHILRCVKVEALFRCNV